jgi:hypothetical protein
MKLFGFKESKKYGIIKGNFGISVKSRKKKTKPEHVSGDL